MFGIKLRDNSTDKKKQEQPQKGKYYVEINPDTEIIRVEDKEQLKLLNDLKELPDNIPELGSPEVCGHWERKLVFLSEANDKEFLKTKKDAIIGAFCKDCGKVLSKPKSNWYPKISYD